jgi:DNA-binding SARP family transcriptional activator
VVSTDTLVDDLWGAQPPPAAANTVQYYVSQLRKRLGADRILTRPPGYLIRVDPGALDLHSFEQLLGRGDADSLREALALWRGAALADVAYEAFAQAEISRLEELRVAALERRIDADLEAGLHHELVGEVEKLVREHPLRERLRGQLMLALYRSGRQAEALEAYRALRAALVDELGVEPSQPLQELERAMLRRDSSLDAPTPAAPSARAILVVSLDDADLVALLDVAEPLARGPGRELIVASLVSAAAGLADASAALTERSRELAVRGVAVRVTTFTSDAPGADAVALAGQQPVDLLLLGAPASLLETGELDPVLETVLASSPCDVGVLAGLRTSGVSRAGPVVVPFGGVEHDWAAVEIAAWLARARETTLRLAGTDALPGERRDASRLLGRASLVVQAAVGVVAEPMLVPAEADGMLAAAADASLLVVGLSDRWRAEGLGTARLALARAAPVPTLLVRGGLRPGGLAPPETMTRFTWTLGGR